MDSRPLSARLRRLRRLYRGVAADNSRNRRLGESIVGCRAVLFGCTGEEAVALFSETNYAGLHHFRRPWLRRSVFVCRETRRNTHPATLPQSEWTVDRFRKTKYALPARSTSSNERLKSRKRSAATVISNGSAGSPIRASCHGTRRCGRSSRAHHPRLLLSRVHSSAARHRFGGGGHLVYRAG